MFRVLGFLSVFPLPEWYVGTGVRLHVFISLCPPLLPLDRGQCLSDLATEQGPCWHPHWGNTNRSLSRTNSLDLGIGWPSSESQPYSPSNLLLADLPAAPLIGYFTIHQASCWWVCGNLNSATLLFHWELSGISLKLGVKLDKK